MACYILDSGGTSHEVSNSVLDSAATQHEIDGYILDSVGVSWLVCITVDEQINAGGEDPEHKRLRYQLIAAQKEDKLIISIVKEYMKHTI